MPNFLKKPVDQAMEAYENANGATLTEQLLAGILAQLQEISQKLNQPASKDVE